jgi:hypothetical protein
MEVEMAYKKRDRVRSVEGEGFGMVAAKLKAPIEDFESGRIGVDPQELGPPQPGPTFGLVESELKVGQVIELKNYAVKIISFEAGYKKIPMIRYKKGFRDESGKINWGPDVLGHRERIETWLIGGKK